MGRRAQFALLSGSGEAWEAELCSIHYDVEGYLRAFTESGVDEIGLTLNKAVKKSIVTGVNYFFKCILAMEEKAREKGAGSMVELPQKDWEELEKRFEL